MESHTPSNFHLFLEKGGNCLVPSLHHMAHLLRWWDAKSQLSPWWFVRSEAFSAAKYSSCASKLFLNAVSKFWVLQYSTLSWNSMKLIHSHHMSSTSSFITQISSSWHHPYMFWTRDAQCSHQHSHQYLIAYQDTFWVMRLISNIDTLLSWSTNMSVLPVH
jgi:hypothetical protein